MTETNFNYTLKLGNTKIEVDIGSSFVADPTSTPTKNEDVSHYHAKHELFLVKDEPVTVIDGEGSHEYKNTFIFIPNFYKHRTVRSTDYRFLFSFTDTGHGYCAFSSFIERFFSSDSIFAFKAEHDLKVYFEDIKHLLHDKSDTGRDAAVCALKLIFYNFYLSFSDTRAESFKGRESYLIIIEKIINSYSLDQTKRVDLDIVAKELHLGKKQTSRIIYKYFGRSLSELVTEKKLAIATNLLLSTDKSVSEIAKESNFHSDNYFFLAFKKAFGVTPLMYRREQKKG